MLSVCLFAAAVLLAPRVAASSEQATIEELKAQVPTKNAAEKLALDTAITFLAGADTKMALELLQQLLRSDSSQVMSQVISRRGMFEAFHMSNIRHSGLYEDCPEALAHVKESVCMLYGFGTFMKIYSQLESPFSYDSPWQTTSWTILHETGFSTGWMAL